MSEPIRLKSTGKVLRTLKVRGTMLFAGALVLSLAAPLAARSEVVVGKDSDCLELGMGMAEALVLTLERLRGQSRWE